MASFPDPSRSVKPGAGERCHTQLVPVVGPGRTRAVRRDAVENREKILQAAADLMTRRGHNVPLTEIADAAGVGVGTLYRGFPDREALLAELQRRGYELLLTSLARIRADGLRGADAIGAYLDDCLELADQLVALPLRGVRQLPDDASLHARRQVIRAIEDFLVEGQAEGSLQPDVTALDIAVCGTLIATPLPHGPEWSTVMRRHIAVFVRGIRAGG